MVIALSKGVADITRTATPYLVQDVLKGSDNVAVLGETATPIYSLIAKPEINTFADLKGKVAGFRSRSIPFRSLPASCWR